MLFYRYIRLTPVYFIVIMTVEIWFKCLLNSTVLIAEMRDNITCGQFWWRNILYVNNWYPFHEFCMIWSWYLASDMQFFIAATLLLIFSAR